MSIESARAVAGRVLLRVERDRAYAAAALNAELERHPQLDPRERALATELTYGVLRTRAVLARHLDALIPRGLDRTDRSTRVHLLVAAYQILFLDRVPPFAAVDAAVSLVRAERGPKIAGFANAVLRRLASGGPRLDRAAAVVESAPAWLSERLAREVGDDEMRALLGATGDEPAVAVRIRPGRPLPGWLERCERGRASPLARLTRGEGDPRRRAGDPTSFVVQEEGAQVVGLALGVRPGDRVLDACAGRGQKTSLLAERLAGSGELWATDVHPAKLERLVIEHQRLGLTPPRTAAVDLAVGVGDLPRGFDRVLVDAPCTGTGTLRRRPEIALRLGPEDPGRLATLQAKILLNAASLARPGGRVIYAVCSVLREEAEDVVARVAGVLTPAPFDAPEVVALAGETATSLRLSPLRHGTDGYFVAAFTRP